VITAAFEYYRPASLDEALRLLGGRDDAKILAGGHSLIPMMKLRLAEPAALVDIAAIPDLGRIDFDGKRFRIGALVTHATLAANRDLEKNAPALWDAANHIGDPQVRNRGTIGGSASHGDPSADYPSVLLALGATLSLAGKSGSRDVGADAFFRGMFDTALAPGEILTTVSFDAAPASAYAKYQHPASGYAMVGVAANLRLNGGTVGEARIAVTGVGDSAFRAGNVEKALAGARAGDADAIKKACSNAASGVDARSDSQASGTYRAAMADVYAARAVSAAAARG
jgi:carbon-monoxide dehydrogenase medium subunit